MNSISQWQRMLLQEIEEKELSPKQQKIAKLDPPTDKIDAGDFAALRAKKGIKEDKDNKFYVSLKYSNGQVATITNLPKHINDTYKDALSSIRILKGYDEDRKLATGHKVEGEWFVSDKNGNPIDQNGNIIKKQEIKEDHEVSMANNSIETIIKHAMDLKAKLGNEEKDIPAWIQDHITNAANFISQAAENYHEYGDHEAEQETEDSLTSIMEKIIKNGHK